MKKILFHLPVSLFSLLALFTSCQKDAKDINIENETTAARSENSGGCRMTQYYYYDAIHDVEQVNGFTYNNGLLDELTASYGWVYKMKHHPNGTMKTSYVYSGDELLYTIQFVHKNNKVVKEIWYLGNTDIVDDEVINTYNEKGELIKNESINYNYYTLYTYDAMGGLESFTNYWMGAPFVKGEYTSNQRYKNPFRSVHGLEYLFTYSNGGVFSAPWWYSSERWIYFDETGNPDVFYDLDPAQTIWTPAQQNYPQHIDYTDAMSGGEILNTFEYENCVGNGSSTSVAHPQNTSTNRKPIGENIKSVLYGPKKGLAERINTFRSKMKNRH